MKPNRRNKLRMALQSAEQGATGDAGRLAPNRGGRRSCSSQTAGSGSMCRCQMERAFLIVGLSREAPDTSQESLAYL